uniref:Uncharacterized protein n=1 Tax=Rhizophora mucronata TaxID=61149 RepID=A0A2P2R0Q6_RHIMU
MQVKRKLSYIQFKVSFLIENFSQKIFVSTEC